MVDFTDVKIVEHIREAKLLASFLIDAKADKLLMINQVEVEKLIRH